jgi:2,3-bisphosphoglycerate-dependent phosphoglycerate mutase
METTVYFIRHAHANFSLENYHQRSLSEIGSRSAVKVRDALQHLHFDYFVSSSSPRALETLKPLAEVCGKEIEGYDELQELLLRGADVALNDEQVDQEIKKVFEISNYKLPGGESRQEVERRGVSKFKELLETYKGSTFVVGTHGMIMTIILGYFDQTIGFKFWKATSKPDCYKVVFFEDKILSIKRIVGLIF